MSLDPPPVALPGASPGHSPAASRAASAGAAPAVAAAEPPPVRHRVQVRLAPAAAFELFTAGAVRWWPMASHSCSADRTAHLQFDGRVGGQVVETGPDGRRHVWGTLGVWQPPERFVMSWHPGRGEDEATRLEVRFSACEGGCDVEVLHDGWSRRGADAGPVREGYATGWPLVLQHLVAAAQGVAP